MGKQFKFAELNLHIFLDDIEIPSKQLFYTQWGNYIIFPNFM